MILDDKKIELLTTLYSIEMNPIDLYVSYLCDQLESELKSDDFNLDIFLANNNLTTHGLFIRYNERLAKIILSADKIRLDKIEQFTSDIEMYYIFVIYDNLIENNIDIECKNVDNYLTVDLPKKDFLIKINKLKSLFDKFINYCGIEHTFLTTPLFYKYFDVLFCCGTFEENVIIMQYIKKYIDLDYRTTKYIKFLNLHPNVSFLDVMFSKIVKRNDMNLLLAAISIFKDTKRIITMYQFQPGNNKDIIKMVWLIKQNINIHSDFKHKTSVSSDLQKIFNDIVKLDKLNTFFLKLDPQQRFAKSGTELNVELLDNRPIKGLISQLL